MSQDKIIQILGEPYFSNDFAMIYNLDCKVGLQKIAESELKITSILGIGFLTPLSIKVITFS